MPEKATGKKSLRRSRAHDPDVKRMTSGQLRRELMRLRRLLRWHRRLSDNSRCWHSDTRLYAALPEGEPVGRMDQSEEVLLRNCRTYIRRQQCTLHGCKKKCWTQR